jgi:predicted nuclease with TOPRIM domain
MAKSDPEIAELKEQLADAMAQVEALQADAADTQARAATQTDRIANLEGELAQMRSEAERLAAQLSQTALRYREARLAAAPDVPSHLVTAETPDEIDEQMEAAERVVAEMRERMEKERREGAPSVPAGAPVRRGPDYTALPPSEKIKVGLEQQSGR